MSENEKILARIREALTVRAVLPYSHGHVTVHDGAVWTPRPTSPARAWLPLVGESFEARLALFQKNSTDLKSTVHVVDDQDHLTRALCDLRDAEGWKKIATHSGELTDEAVRVLGRPVCRTD